MPPGWREIVSRLRRGSVPRGEEFDEARRFLDSSPPTSEAALAVRYLLEGAIADALTSIEDAQAVMSILRAWDRGELLVDELLHPP